MIDDRRFASVGRWSILLFLLLLLKKTSGSVGSVAVGVDDSKDSLTDLEKDFLRVPSPESARQNLRFITSMPHVAGTDGDFVMADYVATQFKEAGIPVVDYFNLEVLLNYPKSPPKVTLFQKNNKIFYKPKLSEHILPQDHTSDTIWRNHTFHGYSPSGDVVGPIVYANYGRPQDFHDLAKAGVSVNGAIVVVRYGQCFRGLKVKNAQLRGAVGVIIYSDPQDDGYEAGSVYPDGPWRPSFGVQRGSVQFNSQCGGDPMRVDTRYANKNQTVENLCGVHSFRDLIPSIPSIPMSYGDVQPILENLGGKNCHEVGGSSNNFCGGLPINYTVGPSSHTGITIRLVVCNEDKITTIPNVIGKIPGTLPRDQDMPVLLGNHRDAWVYGAADPNSGTASLLEVARGLGQLVKKNGGWRPRRSIYLLSWSGEEYGLLGSTGWGELNSETILGRALAYLNVDTAVSGPYLRVQATPSLATLWKEVMLDLNNTSSSEHHSDMDFPNSPIGEVRDANNNMLLDGNSQNGKSFFNNTDGSDNNDNIGTLGSGSDYTVFLDHLGIPSLDFEFLTSHGSYGQYHSIYDSFTWVDQFAGLDGKAGSSFQLMALVAKIWGLLALRLADTKELVPMDVVAEGAALRKYSDKIQKEINGNPDAAAAQVDLTELMRSVKMFQKAAAAVAVSCQLLVEAGDDDASAATDVDGGHRKNALSECNEKLGLVERKFLHPDGLPKRPWFRHVLQAPGIDLGYIGEAFPGIQQAIDEHDWAEAQTQAGIVSSRIADAAGYLNRDGTSNTASAAQ